MKDKTSFFIRGFTQTATLTFFSRISGFIRDIFIAAFFYFSYIVLINIFTKSFETKVYISFSLITLHIIYLYITFKLLTYTNHTR